MWYHGSYYIFSCIDFVDKCKPQEMLSTRLPAFPWSFPPAVTKGVGVSLGTQHKHGDWWQKCFHLCILVLLWQAIQRGGKAGKTCSITCGHPVEKKQKPDVCDQQQPNAEKTPASPRFVWAIWWVISQNKLFVQPSLSAECLPMEMLNSSINVSAE